VVVCFLSTTIATLLVSRAPEKFPGKGHPLEAARLCRAPSVREAVRAVEGEVRVVDRDFAESALATATARPQMTAGRAGSGAVGRFVMAKVPPGRE
jgi:hypothetical protein